MHSLLLPLAPKSKKIAKLRPIPPLRCLPVSPPINIVALQKLRHKYHQQVTVRDIPRNCIRKQIVRSVLKLEDKLGLSEPVALVTLRLLDCYLQLASPLDYSLLVLTALHTVSKVHSLRPLSISTLLSLSGKNYSLPHFILMERHILSVTRFSIDSASLSDCLALVQEVLQRTQHPRMA